MKLYPEKSKRSARSSSRRFPSSRRACARRIRFSRTIAAISTRSTPSARPRLDRAYQHKNEQEWGRLQERLEAERRFLEEHYQDKEAALDASLQDRNRAVLAHHEKQEAQLVAKYQQLQDQLVLREKDVWKQQQKRIEDILSKNRAELALRRSEMETEYAARDAALNERLREMEGVYQKKEEELFRRQQELQDHYRAKEEDLGGRFLQMQTEWTEREKRQWEAHQAKLRESFAQSRQRLEDDRGELEARYRIQEEELGALRAADAQSAEKARTELEGELARRQAEIDASFSKRWAERENRLQQEHRVSLERARSEFDERIAAERRVMEANRIQARGGALPLLHGPRRRDAPRARRRTGARKEGPRRGRRGPARRTHERGAQGRGPTPGPTQSEVPRPGRTVPPPPCRRVKRQEDKQALSIREAEVRLRTERAHMEETARTELDAKRKAFDEEIKTLRSEAAEAQTRLEADFAQKERALRDSAFAHEAQVKREAAAQEERCRKTYEDAVDQEHAVLEKRNAAIEASLKDKYAREQAALQQAWAERDKQWAAQHESSFRSERERLEASYHEKEAALAALRLELEQRFEVRVSELDAQLERKAATLEESWKRRQIEVDTQRLQLQIEARDREAAAQQLRADLEGRMKKAIDERMAELARAESALQQAWIRKESELQEGLTHREAVWLKAQRDQIERERKQWEDERDAEPSSAATSRGRARPARKTGRRGPACPYKGNRSRFYRQRTGDDRRLQGASREGAGRIRPLHARGVAAPRGRRRKPPPRPGEVVRGSPREAGGRLRAPPPRA